MRRPSSPPAVVMTLAAVLVLAYVLLPVGTPANAVYLAVVALGAVAATWGARRAVPQLRRPAQLIAAGLALSAMGDTLWFVITWTGGDPDPSAADLYYLASYGTLTLGVLLLLMPLRGRRRRFDAEGLIDILTVVTVCVLVLWEFVVRDLVRDRPASSFLEETALLYPVVDGVLIGLVLRAMTDRSARRALGISFPVGTACWLVGDFTYLARSEDPRVTIAMNAVWMIGSLLIANATIRLGTLPAMPAVEDREHGTASRLLVAIGPLSVPPGLVVVEQATGRDPESWSLVVGIMVLIVLAFLRTERLLANERQIRRELAATRDAALDASRAKSTFLASISHEIRTPMNGVLGLSRLLASTSLDEHQRQYTQGIERAGESLMTLLTGVLDFAKSEDGRIHVDAIDFDVVEVVEDVASMVAEQAHRQGLELVASCAPELPRALNGDPTKLRQVLLNFASNAVKFTSSGEVVIRASLEPGATLRVRFEVSDTGIGIDPDDQGRLFEAFTQGDDAATHSYGGTGLGLAIARSLTAGMGGELGVDSGAGRGSTFWCTVPVEPARQQILATRPSRARPGARVLVVDDHATTRDVLSEQLLTWGLRVDAADTREGAVAAITAAAGAGAAYALVLLDLQMPPVDGLDVAAEIRSTSGIRHTPLLVLNAGPEVPAARLRELDIRGSLAKPVQVSRLQGAVQRALGGAEPTTPGASRVDPTPMGRGVVLVVEDSEVNQMVAVGTLRQLGYLTEIAANGLEAVEMVASTNYDAVLMDCRMPVMDGYEAAAVIRRDEPLGVRVPIIAVTAGTVRGDRERCLEAGMDDYLAKPLSRLQLAATLARWVPAPTGRP